MFIKKAKELHTLSDEDLQGRIAELGEKVESSNRMGIFLGVVAAGALYISIMAASAPFILATIACAAGLFAGKLAHDGECREEERRLTAAGATRAVQKEIALKAAAFMPEPGLTPDASPAPAPTTIMAPLQLKKNLTPGP